MINIDGLRANLGELWIPAIYRDKVRSKRTRIFAMDIPERENQPEIMHTLLGIELKVGRVRIATPDLSTARYVCVFSRLGCREVAIPYDITKISTIADLLETGWHRMDLTLQGATTRSRNLVIRNVRDEIASIGAGESMPSFDTPTRRKKA